MGRFLALLFLTLTAACAKAEQPSAEEMELFVRLMEAGRADDLARQTGNHESQLPQIERFPSMTHDPEVMMTPAEVIARWDYPVEEYQATTRDGYVLTMQRIPGPRFGQAEANDGTKPVLFLMHGLMASAYVWLDNPPQNSLAFLAADAGIDVWLGNIRGNTFSREHNKLDPEEKEYWKFSIDEFAEFDVEATVNRILEVTKQKQLYYAGHSQGTMLMFAKGSEDPEFGKKIKTFFALAPVTTIGHAEGFGRNLAKWPVRAALRKLGGEFMPSNSFMKLVGKYICKLPTIQKLCSNILWMTAGTDTAQLNMTRLPIYMAHTPAGTSRHNIAHYGQMIHSGKFQKFDCGSEEKNMAKYKTKEPPLYDVSKMVIPTVLFTGGKDILADPTDVAGLIPKLKNIVARIHHPELDHLDYIWGTTSAEKVYKPIIKMIKDDQMKKRDLP